jgi:hypothetical protein
MGCITGGVWSLLMCLANADWRRGVSTTDVLEQPTKIMAGKVNCCLFDILLHSTVLKTSDDISP